MKKLYAEIIVDIALEKLNRPFLYRIPEPMEKEIVPGSVVLVPFGNGERKIIGYVVRITDKTDISEEKIKDILEVRTGCETAEERLIALAAWMSHTYGSTMIQALRTVVPVRRSYKALTERTVSLVNPDEAPGQIGELRKKRRTAGIRVVEILLAEGTLKEDILRTKARVTPAQISRLAEDGIVRVDSSETFRRVLKEAEIRPPDVLTEEQKSAVSSILAEWQKDGRPVLLKGVTGSGKTVVYTELIAHVLEEGKQAIVLIPEIALTWQTVLRFVKRFGSKVSFLHSRLSMGERYDQMKAAKAGEISVMVGPRSALFTPFSNLGLIIIDEEHEETYHSEKMPRYHAREVAIERASIEGAYVVLGSATPSVHSYYKAASGEFLLTELKGRFGESKLPAVQIVDMREELKRGNRGIFSDTLREAISRRLSKGEQTMLFLNRRGYSGSVTCRSCGHVIKCPHCDISLTKHLGGKLICHYCGFETPDVRVCPECGSPHIGGITVGTEQIEEIAAMLWPSARILRMDFDTTRGKDGHGRILQEFSEGGADILIGTQMIVKGHDFPNVTLVGVLLADLSLSENNFRSSERTFQLVTQAVGRAGRGKRAGEAVVQTYHPDHFAILSAAEQDFEAFFREEIAYRKLLSYPPCGGMCAILGSCYDETLLKTGMEYIAKYIRRLDPANLLSLIGPAPQSIGKVRDVYQQVIYIRNASMENLIRAKDRIETYVEMNRGFDEIQIQFDFQ